jgi:site-specific recombinase XerD
MTQLNVEDINVVTLECKVLGKGNKERTVYFDEVAGMMLENYLRERKDDNPALFVTRKSPFSRINPGGVRLMLHKLEEATGVYHVHPHKFRRTRATRLVRHGMPIQNVSAILGHEKVDTTMKYVVMDQRDIKSSYQKFA